ncbi:MAG: FeoB-associated Cys-rich membrane protein [Bacteroidota bacterium]
MDIQLIIVIILVIASIIYLIRKMANAAKAKDCDKCSPDLDNKSVKDKKKKVV